MDSKELRDISTLRTDLAIQAIQKGEPERAIDYIKEYAGEMEFVHNIMGEMMWAMVTYVGKKFGEEEVGEVWRFRQQAAKGASGGIAGKSPEDVLRMVAKIWRAHNTNFTVAEEADRFVMTLNPCSTGGDMLRRELDKHPTNLGKVEKSHNWTWGKKDVSYYCAHCCRHELSHLESGAKAPYWIVESPEDRNGVCVWYVYKDPNKVPKKYINRLKK